MSLIVTGSIGIDTIEIPSGERRENLLGGSCAYFGAAASFYTKTRISAAVGTDFNDKASLEHFNLDLAGLETRKGKTFRWGGKYRDNMDERDTLFTDLNVLGDQPPKIPAAYSDSAFVFLANAPPDLQRSMRKQFPKAKLVVADTMNLWIDTAKDELHQLLKEVDGLVLNYDEAEQLTGKKNTVTAAKELLKHGPSFVVVKKGEHGCIFAHKDGIGSLPAYPAEKVVDPTGAGDSFAGGMMGYLAAMDAAAPLDFDTLRAALAHGTVLASFAIESFSLDRLRTLDKDEIEARFDEYKVMLHVH